MRPLKGFVPWPEEFARRYREQGYWAGITLFDVLCRTAARFPEKTALVDGKRRISYAQLRLLAEALATGLLEAGLKPGERIIFQLANSAELVLAFFALVRIGVIPVMALPAHRKTEIVHFAHRSGAVAHLIPDIARGFDYRELARQVAAECPAMRAVVVSGEPGEGQMSLADLITREARNSLLAGVNPQPADCALMLLSGGTTGLSKLIPRTHDDYVLNCTQSAKVSRFDASTIYLAALPMAHNWTLASPGILGVFANGGTVVIASDISPDAVFLLIEKERITVIAGGVPLAVRWLASDLVGRYDTSSLKVFMNGGAKLVPELRRRIEERFRCTYQESFGCGEGLLNMTRLDDPEHIRFESSGRPVCEADEIKVVDDDGNEVPDGVPGELLTRGPYTVRGYFDHAEANRSAFTGDGFYRMGDIVRKIGGYVYVEGRKKDLINRGGEKISCEEVENFVLANPKVEAVCVVAMPDRVFGEKACAFVIPREGCTLSLPELAAFLQTHDIAKFKMPERLEIVREFPISAAGKILRRELRARIAEKLAQERELAESG